QSLAGWFEQSVIPGHAAFFSLIRHHVMPDGAFAYPAYAICRPGKRSATGHQSKLRFFGGTR
ncbi:hypothetical protein MJN76_25670, partial [Salmonella enterica subsp. enterica serovar Anatum]|uniref:hypothetical protein n=1 Tax=Escherichia coli TaxID=562 RepID=UPI0021C84FBD